MAGLSVLISGAGIAGPTLAFWLAKAGISTTIVERAPSIPTAGQQIDIRGAAFEVVQRMGLEDIIRATATDEQGLAFVNSKGTERAKFPVDNESGRSFSSDIEILRGDLATILMRSTEKSTEYIFNDTITALKEDESGVQVEFSKAEARKFDLVVAADGMRSITRKLAFGDAQSDALKSLGMFTCYFSMVSKKSDGTWAKWYNAPGRRCIMTRPDQKGSLRPYLSIMRETDELKKYHEIGPAGQKKLMRSLFADAGWEASRVLDGMDESKDFYMQEIAQVKMPAWSKGRVALLGDAAYCPSPISGMGTSLAIVGAYNLAGSIAKHKDNFQVAFSEYEKITRSRVEKAQSLPPGTPGLANPSSSWGISIMLGVLSVASKTGIASWIGGGPPKDEPLPNLF